MPKSRNNEAAWSTKKKQWRIDVQLNSRRKSFYSSVPGRKGKIEAERKADEWIENGGSGNPRLEVLWADFLAEAKRTTGSGNYRNLESIGRLYLLPKLKLRRIGSISLQDWQDQITDAYEKGLSRKTCANIRGAVTSLFNFARKNRVSMERPEFLTIPRDAPVGQRTILQPGQIKTLFSVDWIEKYGRQEKCWLIHAWRFIVLTGLRRGEMCGLQWNDIDDTILHVVRSINSKQEETRGKNDNARRYLALSPLMQSLLEDQKEMLKQRHVISPWIFPDEHGNLLNTQSIIKKWYTYRDQHGIHSSIHELRHTMISVVSPEIPDALLKPMVGHSEAMETDQYRHVVDGDAERAAKLVDEVFMRILRPK